MQSEAPIRSKSPRRIRLIAGIVVIVAAAAALLWLGLGRGTVYYYSVSELLGGAARQHIRVAGDLEGGSLTQDGQVGVTFVVRDRENPADRLTVVYAGALPDSLESTPGTEIVAEGDFEGQGIFRAQALITKCPSKYEAAP